MYVHKKLGDRELITPVEMPEGTKAVLVELMRQNGLVVEANCQAMKLLSAPMFFVSDVEAPTAG